ncbi:MAG: elongation factor G-like protein EF-G2 [Actinobacteria bacterium]|nr:elongation factor G-like protein EF-G2 [Actinomycetota bacterium]MCB8997217.1 elongation factor G-like protein EF-G2 [Actinomycetota bacterium]MCB9414643.1 elongation factor G-like protein EF-G2 [Actinomycetota bacterium]HRY10906.1 elongation factor G-like protein EF-G2 [Candidatus Nanopelagicales bacterium]
MASVPQAGPNEIRNVVLVGDSGSGKTTLVEAALFATGALSRPGRVEDGGTVTDYDPVEARQQRSINLALAPTAFDGLKINFIDTPGYADFVGDLRAGLRAADAALFVVSAAESLTAATRTLWRECAEVGMARAVILTKLDHQRASFEDSVAELQDALGDGVLPLYLPAYDGDGHTVTGLIGLLSQEVADYSSGERVKNPADDQQTAALQDPRGTLIETIVTESEDEELLEAWVGGENVGIDTVIEDMEKAVVRGEFYPLIPINPVTGLGMLEVLELVAKGFPSPLEHKDVEATTPEGKPVDALTCDPDGPLLAEVIKTTSEPYVGKLSLVRVFSGTLRPELPVHVSGHFAAGSTHEDHDVDERVGALSSPLGKTQRSVPTCGAGDICAVAKLSRAETGDTLSDVDSPMLLEPWHVPQPLLPIAIEAKTKSDEDKLAKALSRLLAEDPSLVLETKEDTNQQVLWCLGEAHLDVVLDRLSNTYGVQVDTVPLKVSLRETFGAKAEGHGRNVKQSGGHGQYGVCDIEIEPLPQGAGFEFVDKVVGGAVPRQYIPSVEKGVRAQMAKGVAAGYPVTDIRVTLIGGKAHSVDSSDMAFQTAGSLALKDAAAKARVDLLEPVAEITVTVPDDYVGAVMTDLSIRRGRLTGTDSAGAGFSIVTAEVPEIELTRYVVDLRSMSHGTGHFSRRPLGYQAMPHAQAEKVKAEASA